jgi:hypothetical protein
MPKLEGLCVSFADDNVTCLRGRFKDGIKATLAELSPKKSRAQSLGLEPSRYLCGARRVGRPNSAVVEEQKKCTGYPQDTSE